MTPKNLEEVWKNARELLRKSDFYFEKDDKQYAVSGLDFSYGIGPDEASSDKALYQHKSERARRGERSATKGKLGGSVKLAERVGNGLPSASQEKESAQDVSPPATVPPKINRKEITTAEPEPPSESVGSMRVSDLTVSPHRFQYKLGTDAEGVGDFSRNRTHSIPPWPARFLYGEIQRTARLTW